MLRLVKRYYKNPSVSNSEVHSLQIIQHPTLADKDEVEQRAQMYSWIERIWGRMRVGALRVLNCRSFLFSEVFCLWVKPSVESP